MKSYGVLTVFLAAAALSGCTVLPIAVNPVPSATPAPVVPPPTDRLVAAIERNGCELTSGNVGTILLDAQMSQAELRAATEELAASGRAQVMGAGVIRVQSATCV